MVWFVSELLWNVSIFFRDEPEKIIGTMRNFRMFREKSGVLFGKQANCRGMIESNGREFWADAATELEDDAGCDLFRKLNEVFSGQGEYERMNKLVSQTRTINRNRQSHQITEILVELKMFF